MQRGDIPGTYWAVLTHPVATDHLMRQLFADVHMLSHLVGAANRADIRRLRQLEDEKAALEDKIARQQARLRDAVTSREATIRDLRAQVSARNVDRPAPTVFAEPEADGRAVAELRQQLAREIERRQRAEVQLQRVTEERGEAQRGRRRLESEVAVLKSELEAAEQRLDDLVCAGKDAPRDELDLSGLTILYVGGRPQQVCRLRILIEQAAGRLIYHDGGVEDNDGLLAGLVSRADLACFPVDCVSHNAVCTLKRVCRHSGKPYVALRTSGIGSMLRALQSPQISLPARDQA
jgi:hypothetical protein